MFHENHLYMPSPTMTDAVLVIAALLLRIPNMLLLARTVASFACSCEWPETYVKAPRPIKVALPEEEISGGPVVHVSNEAYQQPGMACSLGTQLCLVSVPL
jgi:hypothetical protein